MFDIADWATAVECPEARPLRELVGKREHVVVDPPEGTRAARAGRQAQQQKDQTEQGDEDGREEAKDADADRTRAVTHGEL